MSAIGRRWEPPRPGFCGDDRWMPLADHWRLMRGDTSPGHPITANDGHWKLWLPTIAPGRPVGGLTRTPPHATGCPCSPLTAGSRRRMPAAAGGDCPWPRLATIDRHKLPVCAIQPGCVLSATIHHCWPPMLAISGHWSSPQTARLPESSTGPQRDADGGHLPELGAIGRRWRHTASNDRNGPLPMTAHGNP